VKARAKNEGMTPEMKYEGKREEKEEKKEKVDRVRSSRQRTMSEETGRKNTRR